VRRGECQPEVTTEGSAFNGSTMAKDGSLKKWSSFDEEEGHEEKRRSSIKKYYLNMIVIRS
jgi:hypothetical protein